MSNAHLTHAKQAKNDEFYTRLEDIAEACSRFTDELRGKTIYCPCDCDWSAFSIYFLNNFNHLQLKKLICTGYHSGSRGEVIIKDTDSLFIGRLDGDGSFQSPECCSYRDEADIIITNPPFSLRGVFTKWIDDKDFLIIVPSTAMVNLEVYPRYLAGEINFLPHSGKFVNGQPAGTMWETTFAVTHNPLKLTEIYDPEQYPKYDNYDAIHVPTIKNIPVDYQGVMAVPISSINRISRQQFDILGITDASCPYCTERYGKMTYINAAGEVSKKVPHYGNPLLMIHQSKAVRRYFTDGNGCYRLCFTRLLIRRKGE